MTSAHAATQSDFTLGNLLRARADERGEDVFAYFKDQSLSYAGLFQNSCKVARGLSELGVRKGDTVAILMANSLEYLAVWFGLAMIGAVEVPLNYNYKGRSLVYAIEQSDSRILFVEDSFIPSLKLLSDQLTHLEEVVVLFRDTDARIPDWPWQTIDWQNLVASPAAPSEVDVQHSDLMAIIYTSGSTGLPKGVMLSHRYALYFAEGKVRHMRTDSSDCIFNCYPLFNATGQFETTLPALVAGGKVAHVDRFSASQFWNQIRRYGATEFVYMGGILSILYKQPEGPDDADNSVRAAYGVPTPPEVHRSFERRFGVKLIEVYGSTEANVVTYNPYDDNRVGCCGKPTSGFDIAIVDDDDEKVAAGTTGEILVRPLSPYTMMQGYYKMPDATLKAFRNLWYHSGDLGYVDDDGFLHFVGRKDERIRRLGYNISPAEIESATNTHPQILESTAIGVRNELNEEDVMLVVRAREHCPADPVAIFRFCDENLPYFMVPRYIRFVDLFPMTPTQRVERYRLRDEGVVAGTWDSVKAGFISRKR